MQYSGKLLIIAMLATGVIAGGASWWFRYSATHRAAQFWGPNAARLIRDAPTVELLRLQRAQNASGQSEDEDDRGTRVFANGARWEIVEHRDGSRAPGLTHLRNALLDDRSYDWSRRSPPEDTSWRQGLRFTLDSDSPPVVVLIAKDFDWVFVGRPVAGREPDGGLDDPRTVASDPIAAGLREVFAEWMPAKDATSEREM